MESKCYSHLSEFVADIEDLGGVIEQLEEISYEISHRPHTAIKGISKLITKLETMRADNWENQGLCPKCGAETTQTELYAETREEPACYEYACSNCSWRE